MDMENNDKVKTWLLREIRIIFFGIEKFYSKQFSKKII